jgi:hypothetical protein
MASVEAVTEEALALPTRGRVLLVEKLLASLEGKIDPAVERDTLKQIRERRAAVGSGKSMLVDGPDALKRARGAVRE